MAIKKHIMWTKSEIKSVSTLWETHTTQEIADELGRTNSQVTQMAQKMREAGVNLPKKHRAAYISNLINEFLVENPKFRA